MALIAATSAEKCRRLPVAESASPVTGASSPNCESFAGNSSNVVELASGGRDGAVGLLHAGRMISGGTLPRCSVYVYIVVYYALENQMSDAWVTQGATLAKTELLPPDSMPAINDIMDVLMLSALETRRGSELRRRTSPGVRLYCGLLALIPTYVCTMVVQHFADIKAYSPSLLWQLPQYIFISVSDVLVVPAALELVYSGSSEGSKALAVSFVYLSQGLGNLIDGAIFASPLSLFWQFGISLLVAASAAGLMSVERWWLRRGGP
eukprot:gnl/TRDRNA2_/TRDRNA2_177508_c5_seq10.p1 gnl/TRDRNA2_/TRDRNA2_177508_c5~~gnl/TRDRNA2_/TRDRNA2_177508_c5_seq10.p1  ORF type:complete len:265 (+),score=27.44 gnl/TRDRNA2_/TRDRNA2_177508_c5_seq10:78-872(+)